MTGGKKIPMKIGGVELDANQRENLAKGNPIAISGLTDKSGNTHTSTIIRWDNEKNKVVLDNAKVIKQKQQKKQHGGKGRNHSKSIKL